MKPPFKTWNDPWTQGKKTYQTVADQIRALNPYAYYSAEYGQPKNVGYVQLDGTSGDYIWTADSVVNDISGNIEVVMRVKATDWTAAANQTLAGKYVTTSNQRSWRFYVSTTGNIVLTASADGTVVTSVPVTPTVALVDGQWYWLRMRLRLTNGANSVGTLDIAADQAEEPTSWTANGTNTAAIIASVFNSTSPVEIGSFQNGTSERLAGQVSRCIVRDGFDGEVLSDFDARRCYGDGYYNDFLDYGLVGNRYVPLTGRSGDYVYTADKPSVRITGDIEFVARVSLVNWASGSVQRFIARYDGGVNRSYAFYITGSGSVAVESTVDGTVGTTASGSTTVNLSATPAGTTLWLKATLDVDDGAGNRIYRFYSAADQLNEPTSWTLLGSVVTNVGTTTIWPGTRDLEVGSCTSGTTDRVTGKIYRAIVRNGIGGETVADFDANQTTPFGYGDNYGNGWIIASPKYKGNWTVGLPKIYDRSSNSRAPLTFGAGTNQPLYLPWKNTSLVYLPGTIGNYVSCPDTTALDITEDIEIVARVRPALWVGLATDQAVLGKWNSGTSQKGFAFHVVGTGGASGHLRLYWSANGSITTAATSTVPVGFAPSTTAWIKATFDVNNGADGHTARFFVAPDQESEPTSWTQLGVDVVNSGGAAPTSIFSNNEPLVVGQAGTAQSPNFQGSIYRTIVRNGIGGATVADFNASQCGQSGYTDRFGNIFTVNRSVYPGRKTVIQSPAAGSAKAIVLAGPDDNMIGPAAAVPPANVANTLSIFNSARVWDTPSDFGRYYENFSGGKGIRCFNNGTNHNFFAEHHDGVTSVGMAGAANLSPGAPRTYTVRINGRSATGFAGKQNTQINQTSNNAAVGDVTSGGVLYLLSSPTPGNFNDVEVYTPFLSFDRVLTDAEVNLLEQLESQV